MPIGYKVVENTNRTLFSCSAFGRRLVYKIEKWTRPITGDGPLTLFKTMIEAYIFIDNRLGCNHTNFLIRKCEYIPSRTITVWFNVNNHYYINNRLKHMGLPNNTVFASAIKIL